MGRRALPARRRAQKAVLEQGSARVQEGKNGRESGCGLVGERHNFQEREAAEVAVISQEAFDAMLTADRGDLGIEHQVSRRFARDNSRPEEGPVRARWDEETHGRALQEGINRLYCLDNG